VAVAVHICPDQMSKADYERVIKDLEDSGVGEPEGRTFHAAYGGDQVCMFEVWDSAEHFDAQRDRLMSTLQAAGVDAGTVDVHPLHSHPD
jgi:quinol monooxygenase YgiN